MVEHNMEVSGIIHKGNTKQCKKRKQSLNNINIIKYSENSQLFIHFVNNSNKQIKYRNFKESEVFQMESIR